LSVDSNIAERKIDRLSFAVLLLTVSGTVLFCLWLRGLARENGDVYFLPHRAPAEWIVYPSPPIASSRTVIELDARFRHGLNLNTAPSNATLSLCSFKRCSVVINNVPVPLPEAPPGQWKKPVLMEVAKLLHSGQNGIEVTVYNESGPPALWLSLKGEGLAIASDETWEVSYAGATWRPARLAGAPIEVSKGSPFYGGERVLSSWESQWPKMALLSLISCAVVAGGGWWFKRRWVRFAEGRCWALLSDPTSACLAVLVFSWMLMFSHNAGLLSRQAGYDAPYHLDYIKYIQDGRGLPLANEGMSMYNPPLYYLAAAGVLAIFGRSCEDPAGVILLRGLGLVLAIVHLLLVAGAMRLIFPGQKGKQVIGLLLAGLLPAQIYLSHYVTNEVLLSVLVTATLYACLRALQNERPSLARFAGVGVLMGLALLTKFTALLAVPFVMGAIVLHLFQKRFHDWRIFVRTIGVAVLSCVLVCGWHYARVWQHFGKPLVGAWEPLSGFQWWQDAGYRTSAYFFGLGESLVAPLFSGRVSLADGIFSTMWGDAYCGGLGLEYRPPWDYQLMAASYVLGLFPTMLILAGTVISLARFLRKPEPAGLLLNGLACSFIAAFLYMALKVPCYSQIKAFYGLLTLLPVCVFAGEGGDFFTRRSKLIRSVSGVAFGLWALTSFSTYWISRNSAQAHFLLGCEGAMAKKHDEAVREFSAALETNPGHLLARSMLADSLISSGEKEAADRVLRELRVRHPGSNLGELDCARVSEKEGRLEEAVEHTRLAIAAAPELVVGYRSLASRYARLGRPEQVIAACRDGLGMAPADWELHTLLGRTLAQSARHSGLTPKPTPTDASVIFAPPDPIEEAVHHLRLATRLSSEAVAALDKLAWIRATASEARWRNGEDAVALAERACQLTDYHFPDLIETLAAAYSEAGRFAEAVSTVQKAQTLAEAAGQKEAFKRNEEWLALFGAHQPYRE